MPTVRFTDEEWYTTEAERVLETLRAWLPHQGMDAEEVKARLRACGFGHTDDEFTEIARRLIEAGKVTVK